MPKFDRSRTRRSILAVSIASVLAAQSAIAASLYWDGNSTSANSDGGTGTWDSTTLNWNTLATGGISVSWGNTNADVATFGGSAGMVTIVTPDIPGGTLNLGGLTFTTTGYTIGNIPGNGTLNFGAALGAISTAALPSNGFTTINANLAGTGGLTIAANGDLSATGGGNSGQLRLAGDNSGLTGGITITAGVVDAFTSNAFGTNAITLTNGGGILDANHNVTLSNNISVGAGGGTFRLYGAATTSFLGTVTGTTNINRTDGGTLNLGGDLSGFTGTYNNQGGTTNFQTGSSVLTGTLTVSAGTVSIQNTVANTYAAVNLNGGTLRILSNNSALGTTTLAVGANATLAAQLGSTELTLANDITIAGTSILNVDGGYAPITLNGKISGIGTTLRTASSGTVTLGGIVDMGTGTVAVNSAATLNLASGATITAGTLSNTNSAGVLNVNGATVTVGTISLAGTAVTNVMNVNSGAVTTQYFNIGNPTNNSGRINQTGGTVIIASGSTGFRLGHWNNAANPGSVYNLSGGTLDATALSANAAGTAQRINIGWDGQGEMIVGGGAGTATLKAYGIQLDANGNGGGTGPGDMTLTISANGVVEVGAGNIAGAAVGDRVILNGGTLRAMDATTWSAVMNANPATTSIIDTNSFLPIISQDITGTGTITLAGAGSVIFDPGTNARTVTASLAGTTAIVKNGNGTLNLTGTGSYGGTMTSTAGVLVVDGNYGAATVNVDSAGTVAGEGTIGSLQMTAGGGTLNVNGATAGALTITNGTFDFGAAVNIVNAPISGSTLTVLSYTGSLTGFTNLVLQNASNYRAGSLTKNATSVTVNIGSKDVVWNGTTGGEWDTGVSSRWNVGEADGFYWGDRVRFDDTGLNTSLTLIGELRPASITVDAGLNNYTFTGLPGNFISGGTSLFKRGVSTLTIDAVNAFSGGTTISQGTIAMKTPTALGTGPITLADGGTGANDVALLWTPTANSQTVSNAITVSASGTGTATIGTANNTTTNQTFSGPMVLNRPTTLTSGTTDRANFNGVISGNVGTLTLNATNNGRVVFVGGAANTFVGDVVINAGTTLQLGVISAARDYIPDASNVTVNGTMNFSYTSGGTETINGLNGSGTIGVNAGTNNTLIVGAGNGSGTFTGVIQGAANLGLAKTGTGTQTLTGASTYTGATTVSNGTLIINGSLSGSSTTTINGANAVLAGTGTVGPVTLTNGTLTSGSNSIAALATGNLNLNGGTGLFDLDVAGTNSDQLNATGTVAFGGKVQLALAFTADLMEGTVFTLVANDLTDAVTFTNSGGFAFGTTLITPGAGFQYTSNGFTEVFQLSYTGGTGNDVVLTVIPEPSAALALIGGAAVLVGLRRLPRRK